MNILIIGGTRFLGRHLVATALSRNHRVTLFNRGLHQEARLSDSEIINGDREQDLHKLEGREWDAVIDTCAFLPRSAQLSAESLAQSVGVYVLISSVSVYADVSAAGIDETAPLKRLTSAQLDEANRINDSNGSSYGQLYGGLKALCEQALIDLMPARALIIRPGLIVGPYDYTDRFTYWVARVARGGEVLAPGRPKRPVQFIDARDLAEWIVTMIELKETGTYNATGMPGSVSMEEILSTCKAVTNSNATFTWVSESFLSEKNVAAWSQMPLWLPEENAPQLNGFMFVNCDRAINAGLKLRQLSDTIAAIYSWHKEAPSNEPLSAGLDKDREESLLKEWHEDTSP